MALEDRAVIPMAMEGKMATPMTREDKAATTIERRTSEIRDALTPCAARAEILPTGNPEWQEWAFEGIIMDSIRYAENRLKGQDPKP